MQARIWGLTGTVNIFSFLSWLSHCEAGSGCTIFLLDECPIAQISANQSPTRHRLAGHRSETPKTWRCISSILTVLNQPTCQASSSIVHTLELYFHSLLSLHLQMKKSKCLQCQLAGDKQRPCMPVPIEFQTFPRNSHFPLNTNHFTLPRFGLNCVFNPFLRNRYINNSNLRFCFNTKIFATGPRG